MHKRDVMREANITAKTFRDLREAGIIQEPTEVRVPGQLPSAWEYAPDTVVRIRLAKTLQQGSYAFLDIAEEFAILGRDIDNEEELRCIALRWCGALRKTMTKGRNSVLAVPPDERAPNWEAGERRSLARSVDYRLLGYAESLTDILTHDLQAMAGVARKTKTHPDLPNPRFTLDGTQRIIERDPASQVHHVFHIARDIVTRFPGDTEQTLYTSILPPGASVDDIAPGLLAMVGHVCTTRHTWQEAFLPHLTLRLFSTLATVADMGKHPERYPDEEIHRRQRNNRRELGALLTSPDLRQLAATVLSLPQQP